MTPRFVTTTEGRLLNLNHVLSALPIDDGANVLVCMIDPTVPVNFGGPGTGNWKVHVVEMREWKRGTE